MNEITLRDGTKCEVYRFFGRLQTRALVKYQGLYVFVDFFGGDWDLSGEPASADEAVVLAEATASMRDRTIVDVEKE